MGTEVLDQLLHFVQSVNQSFGVMLESELKKLILLGGLLLCSAACVSDYAEERMSAFAETIDRPSMLENSALYEAISVGEITGTRNRDYTTGDSRNLIKEPQLRKSLVNELSARSMHSDLSSKYELNAVVISASYPPLSMNKINVTSEIQYSLYELETGDLVFQTSIPSNGSAGAKDSIIFPARVGLAIAYSIASNTSKAVDHLVEAFADQVEYAPNPATNEATPEASTGSVDDAENETP